MPPRRINLDKGVPKAHRMVACNRFHYAFRVRHRPKRRAIYVLLFCSFQIRPFESGQNKLAEHTSDVVAFFFLFQTTEDSGVLIDAFGLDRGSKSPRRVLMG